jgi:hypothetical protein
MIVRKAEFSYEGVWFDTLMKARWASFLDWIDAEWEPYPDSFVFDDDVVVSPDFWVSFFGDDCDRERYGVAGYYLFVNRGFSLDFQKRVMDIHGLTGHRSRLIIGGPWDYRYQGVCSTHVSEVEDPREGRYSFAAIWHRFTPDKSCLGLEGAAERAKIDNLFTRS